VSATASLLTNARLKTNATKIPGIMLSEKLDLEFIMLLNGVNPNRLLDESGSHNRHRKSERIA
jgi:hypothetical protein